MLDTVKLRSPELSEADARAVESALQRRLCIDNTTGEIVWDFTSGSLEGSWDHRMSVQVKRSRMKSSELVLGYRGSPVEVASEPYLVVEGSVHKAMLGHNIEGGPTDLLAPIRWLVERLGALLGVELPIGDVWEVRRADWAEVYDLGSFDACQEYLSYLHNVRYPRRKVGRYDNDSIMVAGDTTSLKLYCKGPEFQKHDRARVKGIAGGDVAQALQLRANLLVRAEVEAKAPALDELARPAVATAEMMEHLIELHRRELGRLLREGASEMETVRTAAAVKRRLYEVYSPALARSLYGTWLELSAMGEAPVRRSVSRMTFYRHRKQLESAACSWHDSDVKLDPRVRLVPTDFAPLPGDPRQLRGEAPSITAMLAPFRASA